MAKKNKTYAEEYKREVLAMAAKPAVQVAQLERDLGITAGLIYKWRDQALSGMASLFSRTKAADWAAKGAAHEQEKQDLYAEIGRLTTQLSWLKKSWQTR